MALTLDTLNLGDWVDPTVQAADELEVDLNVYELAAAAVGTGVIVSSVGICAMAAPTVVVPAVAAGSGLAYAGYCKRNDIPLNPFNKDQQKEAASAPQVATVTDSQGNNLDIETI